MAAAEGLALRVSQQIKAQASRRSIHGARQSAVGARRHPALLAKASIKAGDIRISHVKADLGDRPLCFRQKPAGLANTQFPHIVDEVMRRIAFEKP